MKVKTPPMQLITDINQTDKAKKKLKSLAAQNNLTFELFYCIASFHWNYDAPERGTWVKNVVNDSECTDRKNYITQQLGLKTIATDRDKIVAAILEKLSAVNSLNMTEYFSYGVKNKNYGLISEFASFHYLRNATPERLDKLITEKPEFTMETIIEKLFLKLFRGGSIDRYSLEYIYVDLLMPLPYTRIEPASNGWMESFVKDVELQAQKLGLADLRKLLTPYAKGDKYFLQTILEALSYASILKVEGHPVTDIFLPEHSEKLSPHFYKNDWTYPLRFW